MPSQQAIEIDRALKTYRAAIGTDFEPRARRIYFETVRRIIDKPERESWMRRVLRWVGAA